MPRHWSGFKPHEKLTPDNIRAHLKKQGIDPKDFERFVRADIGPSVIQKFFKKTDGTLWSEATLATWKKLYRKQMK